MARSVILIAALGAGCSLFSPSDPEGKSYLEDVAASIEVFLYNQPALSYTVPSPMDGGETTVSTGPHIAVHLWAPGVATPQVSCAVLSIEKVPLHREVRTHVPLEAGPARIVFPLAAPLAVEQVRSAVIQLTLRGQVVTRSVPLRFRRVSGVVKHHGGLTGPFVVSIYPDAYDAAAAIRTAADGSYALTLPERPYHALGFIHEKDHGLGSLESWVWGLDLRGDVRLDAVVGSCSLYNLHAWSTGGHTRTTLLSFRPLCLSKLSPYDADGDGRYGPDEAADIRRALEGWKNAQSMPLAPELEVADLLVTLDERPVRAVFLSKFPELIGTHAGQPSAYGAYLVQVETTPIRPGPHFIRLRMGHRATPWEEAAEHGEAAYFYDVHAGMDPLVSH